jgi:hypothetical protein
VEEERGSSKPDVDPIDPTRAPTDLEALAHHAMELSRDLEQAWSKALDPDLLDSAHEGLRSRWSALVTGLHAAIAQADMALEAAGVDVRLYEWPPRPEGALELELAPEDAQVERRQLQIAQLVAFEQLALALGSVTEQRGVRIDLIAGRETARWWEAGAFALARLRTQLVLRIVERIEAADAVVLGAGAQPRRQRSWTQAVQSLDAAQAAASRGDPEAALLHALCSARERLRALRVDGELADDFSWSDLQRVDALVQVGRLLELAEDAIRRHVGNTAMDPGVALVLARSLLPAVQRLLLHPPVDELAAAFPGFVLPTDEGDSDSTSK